MQVLLDPFGNMEWNVNSGISINVATLIQVGAGRAGRRVCVVLRARAPGLGAKAQGHTRRAHPLLPALRCGQLPWR